MLIQLMTLGCLGFLVANTGEGAGRREDFLEVLPIDQTPQAPEWKMFMGLEPTETRKLWQYHQDRNKNLRDWAWEWRLGWVRKCISSEESYCGQILVEAMEDKALVVRAETAGLLGKRFAGTGFKPAIDLLVKAYKNPQNLRNNKPLWVQYRILGAIRQIGGKDALAQAKRLAGQHGKTKTYWKKLTRF